MSLFKAREWWSTTCGTDETFDTGCMLVTRIGPDKQNAQQIIVGSHEGFIRVYQPNYEGRGDGEEAAENGFRPDDLLLEVQLDQPVLQLMAGRFVQSSGDNCLTVLMPFQVTVFTMNMASGAVEHGTHYALNAVYSHRLKRSAFNIFAGGFGGSKNKELFCVQSLDGTLSFFEQENYAFSRFLPGYLIPGPILYVQKTDSVVTGTSGWTVEAYKYSSLAHGSDANEKPSGDTGSGKRVYADWTYNLGEASLDIQQVTLPSGDVQLVVLAEHSLLVLKESGQLVLFKRLDYHPACITAFVNDAGRLTTVLASHTCVAHVYEGGTLRWAARLPFAPRAVARVQLRQLPGLLALLGPAGQLVAAYLGTTPSLFVAPPVQTTGALDYEALDAELAGLNRVIQKSQAQNESGPALTAKGYEEEVQLVVQIHPVLDPCTLPTEVDQQVPCASIRALISPRAPVQSLLLSFHVTSPLAVVKPSASIDCLTSTTDVEAVVYLERSHAIPSLQLETVASYLGSGGAPRVLRREARLPLALVARPTDPVKDAEHRVTVCTARPSVNLAQLFSDLNMDPSMSSAAGIEYYTGSCVTILASKTSQRYRLQSDDLHALWLITDELTRRIGALYGETPEDPVCSYASSLPLQDVFAEVDAHLLWRQRRGQQLAQLEQRAGQFRAIQRRLLTKYKDATPSPLTNLDQLLEETYRRLVAQADEVGDDQRRLERCAAQLSCAVQLVLLLARLSQALSGAEAELLAAALGWRCEESQEHGWHETVDAAAGYLHRALQQKAGKVEVSAAPLTMPQDTTKLKRHLALLLEKVLKAGAKIGDSVNRTEAEAVAAEDAEARPPSVQPISQMFTQRLGSARPRTGRRPASSNKSRPVVTPSVEVEPPTPLLSRSRPSSSDSVDAEAAESAPPTQQLMARPNELTEQRARPQPPPAVPLEPRPEADGADGHHLVKHGTTSAGIEVPRDNLLDEPEEDFW